jgi:hypothetical protein
VGAVNNLATLDAASFDAALETALRPDDPADPVVTRHWWTIEAADNVVERWIATKDGKPVASRPQFGQCDIGRTNTPSATTRYSSTPSSDALGRNPDTSSQARHSIFFSGALTGANKAPAALRRLS